MTLPVSRLINVSVNLSPLAAQGANLNALLVLGNSDVIDTQERLRAYGSISEVAEDFGSTDPEYLAAVLYYEQAPQPQVLLIGRWARTATHGLLRGGLLTEAELLYDFTTISDGSIAITINGTPHSLTGLNFSAVANLHGVASILQAALGGAATVVWTGARFIVESLTTGPGSTVAYATGELAPLMALNAAQALRIDGIGAEAPIDAVELFVDRFARQFFGLTFADTNVTHNQHLAVAAFFEADQRHVYGVSTQESGSLDASVTTDLGYLLKAAGYKYTVCQYSSHNPYAVASLFGRAFTVDFNGSLTTITLMYKQEPGIVPEDLSTTQANALKQKRVNVFASYSNDTAILQYGTMSGPAFFDEIHDIAWLRDRIETDIFNLLYTSGTKVPQTDAGNHLLTATAEGGCAQGVVNGMIAPGQWNAGGFGTLKQGDFLPKGYYIFIPPISQQAQSDREARKASPMQIAVKLAGAVHTVDVMININR